MTEGASECVYAAHYTYGHNGGDDDDERHDDEADRANSSSNWSGGGLFIAIAQHDSGSSLSETVAHKSRKGSEVCDNWTA